MSEHKTDMRSLLKYGDVERNFIDLTVTIVSSPYIETQVKMDILLRMVDAYNILSNK